MIQIPDGPATDVGEACADALLVASGLLLWLLDEPPTRLLDEPPTPADARATAIALIDRVMERTQREGAKRR
jgi:ABC-type transport system involved in cytochrome c biogenesis ATPase subunit